MKKESDRIYMYSFDEEHFYGSFSAIKEAYTAARDSYLFNLSADGLLYIGCSVKPFKINGGLIDSERIMEDMENTALDNEEAYFDEDPYPLNDEEYKELNTEIARTISLYLSRKFANVSGLGVDTLHRVVNHTATFDTNGKCLEITNGNMGIEPGWEVGNPEP